MRLVGSENKSTAARREDILEAGLDVFLEHGFFQSTLDQVCEKAGISKGSLYHHYDGKEALALALYFAALRGLQSEMYVPSGEAPREGIAKIVGGFLDWFEKNPKRGAFFALVPGWNYHAPAAAPLRAEEERFLEPMRWWFGHWIRHRTIRKLPLHLYEPLVLGPSREFVRKWIRSPRVTELRRARPLLIEAAWRAVAR